MRNKRRGRSIRCGLLAALILLLGLLPTGALAAETAPAEAETPLIIEVVEDIPAEDIEESQVPLAAYTDTPARSGLRHCALTGLLLLAVIGYVIYFRRYGARLYRLRQEAALAELRATGRHPGEGTP